MHVGLLYSMTTNELYSPTEKGKHYEVILVRHKYNGTIWMC